MRYKLYKMSFQTAVHFGNGTLESGDFVFCADTLFSALCQEACKRDVAFMEELRNYVHENQLRFSDAFQYIGDTYYLPKPMRKIVKDREASDSVLKKAYKNLKYIPVEEFDDYLRGEYDVLRARGMMELGSCEVKTATAIRGKEETEPYRIGQYYFYDGNGLYFIVGYECDDAVRLVEELLEYLTYSGIGGKRSSGYGRFELRIKKVPEGLVSRLNAESTMYMSLSVSLPQEDELRTALSEAEYTLCKRSGFVASEKSAKEQMRKKDLYVFKSGACFKTKFNGDIYNVACKEGKHAVYRYAKPLFMGVDV